MDVMGSLERMRSVATDCHRPKADAQEFSISLSTVP